MNNENLSKKLQNDVENWKQFYESNKDRDMLDRDGYPTEIALELIEKWHWSDMKGWFEFIKNIWYFPDCGWKEVDELDTLNRQKHYYYILTAGWSGNESIIRSMATNKMLWDFSWVQSRRGGHYIFELEELEDEQNG